MNNLYAKIMPFIMLGVALVAVFFGLILLAYLFLVGAVVGLILFVAAWIKAKYFSPKVSIPKRVGRTIDHNE
jgi:hypothetical protein